MKNRYGILFAYIQTSPTESQKPQILNNRNVALDAT